MFTQIEVLPRTGDTATVVVSGEVDLASAPDLREVITRVAGEQPAVLVVELSGVTFVDSSGLGAIVGGMKSQRPHRGVLQVAGASPSIRRVFEVAGLGALLAD